MRKRLENEADDANENILTIINATRCDRRDGPFNNVVVADNDIASASAASLAALSTTAAGSVSAITTTAAGSVAAKKAALKETTAGGTVAIKVKTAAAAAAAAAAASALKCATVDDVVIRT